MPPLKMKKMKKGKNKKKQGGAFPDKMPPAPRDMLLDTALGGVSRGATRPQRKKGKHRASKQQYYCGAPCSSFGFWGPSAPLGKSRVVELLRRVKCGVPMPELWYSNFAEVAAAMFGVTANDLEWCCPAERGTGNDGSCLQLKPIIPVPSGLAVKELQLCWNLSYEAVYIMNAPAASIDTPAKVTAFESMGRDIADSVVKILRSPAGSHEFGLKAISKLFDALEKKREGENMGGEPLSKALMKIFIPDPTNSPTVIRELIKNIMEAESASGKAAVARIVDHITKVGSLGDRLAALPGFMDNISSLSK